MLEKMKDEKSEKVREEAVAKFKRRMEEDAEEPQKISTRPALSGIIFCVAIIMFLTFMALAWWSAALSSSKGEYVPYKLVLLLLIFLALTVISFIIVIVSGIISRK